MRFDSPVNNMHLCGNGALPKNASIRQLTSNPTPGTCRQIYSNTIALAFVRRHCSKVFIMYLLDPDCVFRSIRPPIPMTAGHLFRRIRPPVTLCREAVGFGYQV